MAALKVFVSSTAYDLAVLRSTLKGFIEGLGFEAILSDYSDVLYDPRHHTQESCLAEVRNCDFVILVIGSRFGGEVVPSIIDDLGELTGDILSRNGEHKFSITQAECLTAFALGIPVFTFVEARVLRQYDVYSHNPGKEIYYPAIAQPGTEKYIFEFISYIRKRASGNAMIEFNRIEEIIDHLRKQWASLFQRLLRDSRERQEESRRIDRLSEEFKDLKAALLATVRDSDVRRVAQGVIRYRKLIEFMRSLPAGGDLKHYATEYEGRWEDFLRDYSDAVDVKSTPKDEAPYTLMTLKDGSAYLFRMSAPAISRIQKDWDDFNSEAKQMRTLLYDTLADQRDRSLFVQHLTEEAAQKFMSDRIVPRQGGIKGNNDPSEI